MPTPRFVCKACCLDKNHCVNRKEEGFLSGILEGIKDIRRALRDSCHEWRLTNYKVVNGCTLLELQEESSFQEWEDAMGQDSVHLTEKAYGKLAEEIFPMSEGFEAVFSGGKRERGRRRRRGRTQSSQEGSRGCTAALLDKGEEEAGEDEAAVVPPEEDVEATSRAAMPEAMASALLAATVAMPETKGKAVKKSLGNFA